MNVSEKTKEEMVKFFLKTSVPRIIEDRKLKIKKESESK